MLDLQTKSRIYIPINIEGFKMTYKDQLTTVPISHMVLDVGDELYDHSEMTGMFIGLNLAVYIEKIAANITHEAIKKAMS